MSVESAKAYIERMRSDEAFRHMVNDGSEDEAASWALLREHGFDFTMQEFREAQDLIYAEYGITPM
ncbi:Nif11-like leader peptide family natural product precursor [Plasticicumulans acidivorans]|uniref:Putative ribosomally synthesized peptide with nif11-like leader n=1 Tax=Plasticicumulans acidivorans TaxID=886464 RepID=A0A317MTS5_9GAMM|nr:Nif11-like leader peptide family natural product precursor [Plasticicumulans acidivorans]PWV60999.1 putative ribosomally synthesized peptide with nif11-like leader [Plasticicumulans acidivorans]